MMTGKPSTKASNSCLQCEGKGYVEIRDCTGEIQRSETCVFCDGTGRLNQTDENLSRPKS